MAGREARPHSAEAACSKGWGHLEGEGDDLVALGVALQAGVTVGLETREGRKRDLLLTRILPCAWVPFLCGIPYDSQIKMNAHIKDSDFKLVSNFSAQK